MQTADQLKHDYIEWLKQKVVFSNLPKAIEITTPFLNSNQDYIQIYAVPRDNGDIYLTDDGSTLNELYLAGFEYSSGKRKELIEAIIKSYGVSLSENDELFVNTSKQSFPNRKHSLLQAMIKVNDMLLLSRRNVKDLFTEDVKNFLKQHDIRAMPNFSLTGATGYTQKFDFAIPASRNAGERFIQAFNGLDKTKVQSTLFAWDDIKQQREDNSSLYVFVNESKEKKVNEDAVSALERYSVKVVRWPERKKVIPELSA